MRLCQAGEEELERVFRFYREVCAAQATDAYGPGWHYGVYPDEGNLVRRVRAGELYLCFEEDATAAAFVLSDGEDELYQGVPWRIDAEKVCVLHLFAVHPSFRGRGLGKQALKEIISLAEKRGAQAVHLDVVKDNLPAERMYRTAGFAFCEEKDVYYVDTGDITVELFEYGLRM